MLRIRQIKIPVENSNDEVLLSKIAKILHIKTSDITSAYAALRFAASTASLAFSI